MPAKTISDAFLGQGRARKIVSMTELQAQLESKEAALELTGVQKLARAFNRSAVVSYVKSVTIGAWRVNKMPLYKNNVQMGTFDVKTSAKTSEILGHRHSRLICCTLAVGKCGVALRAGRRDRLFHGSGRRSA